MNELELAHEQLHRMRGMTRYYHQRFFSDIRIAGGTLIALLVVGFAWAEESFLLVPVVALLGANQTAFDASYLIFARQYAARLERHINSGVGREVLVGAYLEDAYLFPLDTAKVVTIPLKSGFSWFSWMTVLYTVLGMSAFLSGLALGRETLVEADTAWAMTYLGFLGVLTAASFGVGWWWFVRGEGERRLSQVLDSKFATPASDT